MTICTVVATFVPKPEFRDEIKLLLQQQAVIVKDEPGCQYYDLYEQVNGNLVFVEAWSTRELWISHNDAPTVKAINAGVEGKLLSPVQVQELYQAN